jgi:RNA polymerase sigma factor (sigma-70 family)
MIPVRRLPAVARNPRSDFEEVFEALYPRAWALAYRLLGEHHAADDITAEAFARLLLHWTRVRRLPYRDGWLFRVTTNLALDAGRKQARHAVVDVADGRDLVGTPVDELVVLQGALVQALRALPSRQREAIVLVHLVGLSPGDAASAMHVSSSSVSQHMRRGLDRLRGQLTESPRSELSIVVTEVPT